MNYSDIENKSIFDFCKDPIVLEFISGITNPTRKEYLKKTSIEDRISDLRMLAFVTDDDLLDEAVYPFMPAIIEWTNEIFEFRDKRLSNNP